MFSIFVHFLSFLKIKYLIVITKQQKQHTVNESSAIEVTTHLCVPIQDGGEDTGFTKSKRTIH